MKHELAGGGWAEIRPVADLKGADRTAINHYMRLTVSRAAEKAGADEGAGLTRHQAAQVNLDLGDLRIRGMLARAVTGWSFREPVPEIGADGEMVHEKSTELIPLGPLGEIEELIVPHIRSLLRRPDPKETTTSASNGRSPAKAKAPTG